MYCLRFPFFNFFPKSISFHFTFCIQFPANLVPNLILRHIPFSSPLKALLIHNFSTFPWQLYKQIISLSPDFYSADVIGQAASQIYWPVLLFLSDQSDCHQRFLCQSLSLSFKEKHSLCMWTLLELMVLLLSINESVVFKTLGVQISF